MALIISDNYRNKFYWTLIGNNELVCLKRNAIKFMFLKFGPNILYPEIEEDYIQYTYYDDLTQHQKDYLKFIHQIGIK